jgi:hypothetical protein
MPISDTRAPDLPARRLLDHDDVRRIAGDVGDAKIAAILATRASCDELEEAIAWASGESDVMGEARLPLSGTVGQLYDILVQNEDVWGDEDRPISSPPG